MTANIRSDLIIVDNNQALPDTDVLVLGLVGIDDNHEEFAELLLGLEHCQDHNEYKDLYHELHLHSERHFDREFDYMQACNFPALIEHHAEHRRILNELVHYRMRLGQGRAKEVHDFVEGRLTRWFNLHVNGPDLAMALYPLRHAAQKGER